MNAHDHHLRQAPDTVRTDRLFLRPPNVDDADAITALADNWKVVRNLAVLPYPYLRSHAVQWLSSMDARRGDGSTVFAVCLADDAQTLIGICGCGAARGAQAERLGYWFGEPWWGHGYATEAARALVRHVLTANPQVDTLHSECHQDNPASRNVLEKCGFAVIAESVEHCVARGDDVPGYKLSLARADWERSADAAPVTGSGVNA